MPSGGYRLVGQEIEACDCSSICPCVFGEEPEHGSCVGVLARHITEGEIAGVAVGGLSWLEVFLSPGHQLEEARPSSPTSTAARRSISSPPSATPSTGDSVARSPSSPS